MIKFTLKTDDKAQKYLFEVEKKLDKTQVMLTKAGIYMLRSIDKNFREQGRPEKWKGLAPLTVFLRRKGRKRKGETREQFQDRKSRVGVKILNDTGRLKGSIFAKVTKNKVAVGTNVSYAKLHQFGGMSTPNTVKRGKSVFNIGAHKVPARPFLLFQKQDIKALDSIGLKYVEDATK